MADKTAARVVRVSRSRRVDVWADNVVLDDLARASFTLRHGDEAVPVHLAVFGDHQVSNALCAAAVALECGATGEQVAAALAAAGPASPSRMDVVTRSDGVTVINDAYNANPDSMRAGLQALAWMARPETGSGDRRRSWAVLGEMAELGDDAISEHDRIGRLAVRLDVSRLVVVGTGRSMSAMHQGAVMEGSWGAEATRVDDVDAALAMLRAELRPGDVVLVKASNSAGLAALAQALLDDATGTPADETDPDRRRPVAGGVDPADAAADPAVHPAGLRPRDPRGRPAQPQDQARHPVDGRCGDPGRHLGRVSGHAPDRGGPRRRRAVGVGPAGTRPGHRARLGRLHRRPDQDPPLAQPRPEQDRQDRRADHRRGAVRRAGAGRSATPTDSHRAARNCPMCARSPPSP